MLDAKAIGRIRVTSLAFHAGRQLLAGFGWPAVSVAVERSVLRSKPAVYCPVQNVWHCAPSECARGHWEIGRATRSARVLTTIFGPSAPPQQSRWTIVYRIRFLHRGKHTAWVAIFFPPKICDI